MLKELGLFAVTDFASVKRVGLLFLDGRDLLGMLDLGVSGPGV